MRNRRLTEVNLEALSSCFGLYSLVLSKNQLNSIYLCPIGKLSTLKGLNLRQNNLKNIKLSSLQYLKDMDQVDLRKNPLQEIVNIPSVGKVQILQSGL
jgi:Leucine-rich repeat (LRR) protein